MATPTVVVGPPDGLSRALTTELAAVAVAPESDLPSDLSGVVIVADPPPSPVDAAALGDDDWRRRVDDSMWRTLTVLQRARSALAYHGGRIVVVHPTIGMAGAAGLVAYTTAVEGIRAMAKSAARQWSSRRVGVNLVAVPLAMFTDDAAAAAAHLTVAAVAADAYPASTLIHTVAESVKFLLRRDIEHLAGETIVADGGSVMLP